MLTTVKLCLPITLMVKVHFAVLPAISVALSLIFIEPIFIFILEEKAGMVIIVGLYPELSATKQLLKTNTYYRPTCRNDEVM